MANANKSVFCVSKEMVMSLVVDCSLVTSSYEKSDVAYGDTLKFRVFDKVKTFSFGKDPLMTIFSKLILLWSTSVDSYLIPHVEMVSFRHANTAQVSIVPFATPSKLLMPLKTPA